MSNPELQQPDQILSAESGLGNERTSSNEVSVINSVTEPAKVMRIGSMVKQLLEEVRGAELDQGSRERLAEIYERSIVELTDALSPDLQQELTMLALPFSDGIPSEVNCVSLRPNWWAGLRGSFTAFRRRSSPNS